MGLFVLGCEPSCGLCLSGGVFAFAPNLYVYLVWLVANGFVEEEGGRKGGWV